MKPLTEDEVKTLLAALENAKKDNSQSGDSPMPPPVLSHKEWVQCFPDEARSKLKEIFAAACEKAEPKMNAAFESEIKISVGSVDELSYETVLRCTAPKGICFILKNRELGEEAFLNIPTLKSGGIKSYFNDPSAPKEIEQYLSQDELAKLKPCFDVFIKELNLALKAAAGFEYSVKKTLKRISSAMKEQDTDDNVMITSFHVEYEISETDMSGLWDLIMQKKSVDAIMGNKDCSENEDYKAE